METSFDTYKRIIVQEPSLEDSWFSEALEKCRAGDEAAQRQIVGSCLKAALQVVEGKATGQNEAGFFDLVQEANAALSEAVANFPGGKAQEFLLYAEQTVHSRLEKFTAQEKLDHGEKDPS